jgi:nucleoporin NUP82
MQTLLLLQIKKSECRLLGTSSSVEVHGNLIKYVAQPCSSVLKTHDQLQTLHTPNLQFEIRQISLNPSGKLLAVAGTHQVAVVVLPRAGYSRLVPEVIDCKYALPLFFKLFPYLKLFRCVQIGQFYHAANTSAVIAIIDWHPWGEAGSTLLVMTVDGKLRYV